MKAMAGGGGEGEKEGVMIIIGHPKEKTNAMQWVEGKFTNECNNNNN